MKHHWRIPKLLLVSLVWITAIPYAVQAEVLLTKTEANRLIQKVRLSGGNLTAGDVAALEEKARLMIGSDFTKEARELLKILISTKYVSARQYCLLAATYNDVSGLSTEQSRKCYLKALELDPQSSKALCELAELELLEGRADTALKYAQKSIACKQRDGSAYLSYAKVLSYKKNYKEALKYIALAEKANELGSEMAAVKAGSLENLGRYDLATEAYRQSYAIKKKDWTLFQIVRCLDSQKKYAEAIAEIDKVIKINPRDGEAFRTRAALRMKNKDLKGALKDMDQSIELEPTSKGYTERANMHKLMGHPEQERKDLAEAKRILDSPF